MGDRICFVYVFATSGGVERVFLNRAEALLRENASLEIDVFFYHDYGGVPLFERYLSEYRVRSNNGQLVVDKNKIFRGTAGIDPDEQYPDSILKA